MDGSQLSTTEHYNSIFWDITPCSPLKFNRYFRGIFYLHLQVRRKTQARIQREAGSKQIEPEDGGDMSLLNVGWLRWNSS
jgi:hypothetical protein